MNKQKNWKLLKSFLLRIKNFIDKTLRLRTPHFVLNRIEKVQSKMQFEQWKKDGCFVPPPPIIKQIIIAEYQQKYLYSTLIETGTYMGEMIEAQKARFKKIVSIELSIDLYNKAKRRFNKDNNISILQGDSSKILPKILADLKEPAIFWLDGHFSGGITAKGDKDSPIIQEIETIINSKQLNHIILIDDARLFNGEGDYPTIDQIIRNIKNTNYQLETKHDIIVLLPSI